MLVIIIISCICVWVCVCLCIYDWHHSLILAKNNARIVNPLRMTEVAAATDDDEKEEVEMKSQLAYCSCVWVARGLFSAVVVLSARLLCDVVGCLLLSQCVCVCALTACSQFSINALPNSLMITPYLLADSGRCFSLLFWVFLSLFDSLPEIRFNNGFENGRILRYSGDNWIAVILKRLKL